MASTSEYWVGDVIGEGSFGAVVYGRYKQGNASQQKDKLHVAIKCIDKNSLLRQPSTAMAVVQEQRLLKRLKEKMQQTSKIDASVQKDDTNTSAKFQKNNNFIVDLYASFHDAECVYIVLECCSGGTLQDLLDHFKGMNDTESNQNQQIVASLTDNDDESAVVKRTATLLLGATQYFGIQLVMGISFLHASSVIHCDIKPSNILLTNYGCIKISDFGCSVDLSSNNAPIQAKVAMKDSSTSSTFSVSTRRSGRMILPRGTAAYAAPELNRQSLPKSLTDPIRQSENDDLVTPTFAVDLWSLGCILYACLLMESHHRSPFDMGSEATSIQAQKVYCDIIDTNARHQALFGKDILEDDDTKNESEEFLQAFRGMIAALLNPKAEERIDFAKVEPQKKSVTPDSSLPLPLQQRQELPSVSNIIEDPSITYPNLQRNIIWATDEATDLQNLPLRTDFLPRTPSWWVKNSTADIPGATTSAAIDGSDSSTTNVLMDGAIGWSAFLV